MFSLICAWINSWVNNREAGQSVFLLYPLFLFILGKANDCKWIGWIKYCGLHGLTHCGLVRPQGDRYLGQHWLRWWLVSSLPSHYWTNVGFSLLRFCGIHLRVISGVPQLLFYIMSLKIMFLKSLPHLPGANELSNWGEPSDIQRDGQTDGQCGPRQYPLAWGDRGVKWSASYIAPSHHPNLGWLFNDRYLWSWW